MRRPLPRMVWLLGAVSFLTDMASDMVYPLLPQLLVLLGGGPRALGVMEGVAELLASLVKLQSGRASDRVGRRGPFVVVGYALATLSRPVYAFVSAPWQVVLTRAVDRVGKGLRAAPRDAIVAAVTPEDRRGLAFGVHRGLDNLGAVVGGVLAWLLLSRLHVPLRSVFLFAVVPGVLSTILALVAVGSERRAAPREGASSIVGPLPSAVKRGLVAIALFALASSADSFLLARLSELGLPLSWVPIAWIGLQVCKAALNVPGGALADRVGHRRVLLGSWGVYALAYALFACASAWWTILAVFPLYALHYGLGEGAEKALVSELCPEDRRGTAFGAQLAVHGLALLPANVAFGWIYATSPRGAFLASAVVAAVATVGLAVLVPRRAPKAA